MLPYRLLQPHSDLLYQAVATQLWTVTEKIVGQTFEIMSSERARPLIVRQ